MSSALGFGIVGWDDQAQAAFRALGAVDGAEVRVAGASEMGDTSALQEMFSARFVQEPEAVIESDDVEAVFVAAAAGAREALVHQALAARKHMLMPAPLALDAETALRLLEAASEAGVALCLTTPWPVDPALVVVRRQIRADLFGQALLWQSVCMASSEVADWRIAVATDLGLFHYLTGVPATGAMARRVSGSEGAEVILLNVAFEHGAAGVYTVGARVVGAQEMTAVRGLVASRGQVDLSGEPRAVRGFSTEDAPAGAWQPIRYVGRRADLEDVIAGFVQRVRAGDAACDREALLEVPRILDAARRSLDDGGTAIVSI